MATVDGKRAIGRLRLQAAAINNAVGLALSAAVEATTATAKGTSRFANRSGETRNSIHGERFGFVGRVIAKGAAWFLEFGTKAHVIRPRDRHALRFVVAGAPIFRKWVNHPGTDERPFMRQARMRGVETLRYALDYYINYALTRI